MNPAGLSNFINQAWDEHIVPALCEYIKIPNKSPQFDANWREHGYMQQAVALMTQWCETHAVRGMRLEVVQSDSRTPLIFIEVPGNIDETILLYGHLDKQPEMRGWDADLHPWKPVQKGDKLYGRGAADDGYAIFASLTAIKALQEQNIPHARCVILIEASEESGSSDLPFYVDALKEKIGQPNLVICLDSGCGNYDQLWVTTSLRGLVAGTLKIEVLSEGIHSGQGSGVVPACFRILRQLLDRVESEKNGEILLQAFQVNIPENRLQQAAHAAQALQHSLAEDLPFVGQTQAESADVHELIIRRTWKAALSVIGEDGMPAIADAGNVTLPSLAVKLSIRIPPTCHLQTACRALEKVLTEQPPYQANVSFTIQDTGPGWHAPAEAPWLKEAAREASQQYFGKDAMYMGEGGSIPFMGMLGEKFPQAQFLITGVLGPKSNAHGPNEFLHIPTGKKLTACVAHVIAKHYQEMQQKA